MTQNNVKKLLRILFVITVFVVGAIACYVGIRLILSFALYIFVDAHNVEANNVLAYSPYANTLSSAELSAELKAEFAQRCWACRIVSGNTNLGIRLFAIIGELILLCYTGFGVAYISFFGEPSKKR